MPLSAATPLPYPRPALGRSCPRARTGHQPTLIKTPLMRWAKYLNSSQPSRATSSQIPSSAFPPSSHSPCPPSRGFPPRLSLVLPWRWEGRGFPSCCFLLGSSCFLLSASVFRGRARLCGSIPAWSLRCAVACVLLHHALDPLMEPELWLDEFPPGFVSGQWHYNDVLMLLFKLP